MTKTSSACTLLLESKQTKRIQAWKAKRRFLKSGGCSASDFLNLDHAKRCIGQKMKKIRALLFMLLLLAGVTLLGSCAQPARMVVSPTPALSASEIAASPVADPWPGDEWPTSEPEQQGLDAGKLKALLAAVDESGLDLHSVLVIRNGYLVFEWYDEGNGPSRKHVLYSVTKSFTGTLVGIAIDQGLMETADQLLSDFLPVTASANPDTRKDGLTLENLLTMQAGLDWSEGQPTYREMYSHLDWVAYMLDKPLMEIPGTSFNYCSGCSHLLAAALTQAIGGDLIAFARENLFEPLGITDISWEKDPQGIPIGGWGLYLTPRDMARLGYLYLRQGVWNGRQVVSSEWVAASTQTHVMSDERMEYGYHWWIYPSLHAYAALGLGGQTVFVLPEQDLVVVFTADNTDHAELVELIEDYIIPAEDER